MSAHSGRPNQSHSSNAPDAPGRVREVRAVACAKIRGTWDVDGPEEGTDLASAEAWNVDVTWDGCIEINSGDVVLVQGTDEPG